MPWLFRRNSSENGVELNTSDSTPPNAFKAAITFVPATIDISCGTSPLHHRQTPLRIFFDSIKITAQNLECLPHTIRSISNLDTVRDAFKTWIDARETILQVILAVTEIWALSIVIPAILFLPGIVFAPICAIFISLIAALSWSLNKLPTVTSLEGENKIFANEAWIFVPSSGTSNHQLEAQLAKLQNLFSRRIKGVHNPTYGLVLDLLFHLSPIELPDSANRNLYLELRNRLLDTSIQKVVILAHGTGCSILSSTIDALFSDLPGHLLGKIEIYTFGSAAQHFSNPRILSNQGNEEESETPLLSRQRLEERGRMISHIEHYALSTDLLARTGILHHSLNILDNTYCGRLFILNAPFYTGVSLSHYLSQIFSAPYNGESSVLSLVPHIDVGTAEKREFTAQGVSLPLKSTGKRVCSMGFGFGSVEKEINGVEMIRQEAKACEGKTVRQLSRLWMYRDCGRPAGERIAVSNGVGLGLKLGAGKEGKGLRELGTRINLKTGDPLKGTEREIMQMIGIKS